MSKKKKKLIEIEPMIKKKEPLTPCTTGQIVKLDNGDIAFKADNGLYVDISQTPENYELYASNEKCVISLQANKTSGIIAGTLGKAGDPIPEGRAIAARYGIKKGFTNSSKTEALLTSKQPVLKNGIMDYSSIPFFTIDPTNSKDFDDAIYVEKKEDGSFSLYVGIANVSKYVSPEGPLFHEAILRGNSSYLGDQVYPMLPEELSNDACSLNEKKDKYAIVTTINYSPSGNITSYSIGSGVINSRKRLTYPQAQDIHECKNGAHIAFSNLKESIDVAYELSELRKNKRNERGAFDISGREPEFTFNEDRTKVISIKPGHQETSTEIVASFMIDANDVWGNFAERSNTPFVFRCHDALTKENEIALRSKLAPFGIYLPKNPTGKHLQNILGQVSNSNLKEPITAFVLKSLKHAYYSTSNNGHLGLGVKSSNFLEHIENKYHAPQIKPHQSSEDFLSNARNAYFEKYGVQCGICATYEDAKSSSYGHTTSPIRRGADLLNQGQINSVITTGSPIFTTDMLKRFCDTLNQKEFASAKAEGEYNRLLTALWAQEHLGTIIDGVVVDHAKSGIIILDKNRCCQICVPYSELNHKREIDKYYGLGSGMQAEIYEAKVGIHSTIHASENLEKYDQMQEFNTKNSNLNKRNDGDTDNNSPPPVPEMSL